MINHTSPLLATLCFWQALLSFKNQARVMDLCMAIVRHVPPVPNHVQLSLTKQLRRDHTNVRRRPLPQKVSPPLLFFFFFFPLSFEPRTYNVQIGTVGRVQILVLVCEFYIWYILWSDWKQLHHDCYTCQHVVCRQGPSGYLGRRSCWVLRPGWGTHKRETVVGLGEVCFK